MQAFHHKKKAPLALLALAALALAALVYWSAPPAPRAWPAQVTLANGQVVNVPPPPKPTRLATATLSSQGFSPHEFTLRPGEVLLLTLANATDAAREIRVSLAFGYQGPGTKKTYDYTLPPGASQSLVVAPSPGSQKERVLRVQCLTLCPAGEASALAVYTA